MKFRRLTFLVLAAMIGFDAALGADAPAAKRVLFFSKSSSFQHSVIKTADGQPSHVEKVLAELGPKERFVFTCTKDGGVFTPEKLAPFAAVIFYTTGDLTTPGNDKNPPMPAEGKRALLDFIASGRGFVGVHSATDTFHTPKGDRFKIDATPDPYIAMLGGEFITHGSQQTAKMRCADPKFPGMSGAAAGFQMLEEWYSLKNFPKDLHVLLVQETADMTGNAKGNPYDRPPYPATWARMQGKGRVFYTSMGHKPGTWTNPLFQQIFMGGLNWAAGNVDADVTPNIEKITPGFAQMPPSQSGEADPPAKEELPGIASAAPPSTSFGNLAQGKLATASGEQGGVRPNLARHAVDGDAGTYWAAKTLDFPQWLQVDLGRPERLSGSRIEWPGAKDVFHYRIEVSPDGKAWKVLADGSQNARKKVVEDKFDAPAVRYARLTLLGIAGNPRVRPGVKEWQILGETAAPAAGVAAAGARADHEQKLLREVRVPDGFAATIFAAPAAINYPTAIAAAPDGTLYVACDRNGAGGREPHRGRIVRLRDTDGDGRADEVKEFVKDVDSPRGILWDHDRLYVLHPPHLSAFIDKDGDGVADEEKVLVKNIGWSFKDRSGDHASNGVEIGIDGWLYCAIGDFGFFNAEGTDGRKAQLRGGGVVRVRPDGTGLEIYARGTRNIYKVAVDPLLNVFARDNNNDGSWGVLLHHFTGLDQHGYPSLFLNFAEDVAPPLADYVTGSGSGALYLDEPGFPGGFGRGLYTADWGRSWVYRHPLTPAGATFKAGQTEFIGVPRTIDLVADAMSRLYVASWRGAIFNYSGEDVGYVARVVPKGYKPEPVPDFDKATETQLVKWIESPSHRRRLEAQRALLRRGISAEGQRALTALARDPAKSLAVRVAAVFTLKQSLHEKASVVLAELAADATLRPFAIRALTDNPGELAGVPTQPILAALQDSQPRARLEAAVALARLGKIENAAALATLLGDADPIMAHTAVQALVRLQATDICFAIVDRPGAPTATRAGALRVLQTQHEPQVVSGLIARLAKETDAARRQGLLAALCRLHFREGEWKGAGWGLAPDTAGPYFQIEPWSESAAIAATLKDAINQAKGDEAAFLVAELNRNRIHSDDAVRAILTLAAENPKHLPAAVSQLAHSQRIPADGIPLLIRAAADSTADDEVRANAVVALARTGSAEGCAASLSALAAFETQPRARKLRNRSFKRAREAFFQSPNLAELQPFLAAEAAKLNSSTAPWADAALLKIAALGSAPARTALEAGWAEPKRRAQIVQAIALGSDRTSKDKVLAALSDPDPAVAAAAREAARTLRLDASAKPGKPGAALIANLKPETVIAAVTKIKGDPELGEQLFTQQGCAACHTVSASEPPRSGPFLGGTAGVYQRAELAEAILFPSKSFAQGFEPQHLSTKNGDYIGFIKSEDQETIVLRDMAMTETRLSTKDVTKREPLETSLMPAGLAGSLTEKEFAALLAYLESLTKH
jgi:putative membrane-bound dehydrogenase-like protein